MDQNMSDHVSLHNITESPVHSNETTPSYWSHSDHSSLIYWHICLSLLAWAGILPVAVMLSISRSRFVTGFQASFIFLNVMALLLGVIYNRKTPDLYSNNTHGHIGWIVLCMASVWITIPVIRTLIGSPFKPSEAMGECKYDRVEEEQPLNISEWSDSFHHSRSLDPQSLEDCSSSPSMSSIQIESGITLDEMDLQDYPRRTIPGRLSSYHFVSVAKDRAGKPLQLLYTVLERTLLLQGFVAAMSGTIVFSGIGHGVHVFNVIAHYIKGSIFFLYGLLTLGRWMGAFAEFGWAWNLILSKKVAVPSAEFTESFVIFLYGATNVFLEHLSAWGEPWTARDLEHVSISFMFFGGGLLGMIVESKRVRSILSNAVMVSQTRSNSDEKLDKPRQYGVSMNPMPSLVIFFTGKMMSSHHQGSMLSTSIHTQWGDMLMGFAIARCVTYITIYINTPTSVLPSRPPTEIIASFCLISGGITFVLSNRDTVAAIQDYGLDAMFIFTVVTGISILTMAWTVITFCIKALALQKEVNRQ